MRTAESAHTIDRSVNAASRFLDALEQMPADARAHLSASSFGSHDHTTAMMTTADELTTLRQRDPDGRVGQFIVAAERRIAQLGLDAELAGLAKGAVRALLVHHLPGREDVTRQLYAPFESVIPMQSLVRD
jgi:hypothetical protein